MKKRKGKIELEGLEFKAYHGCLEHEKVEGNLFEVDFAAEMDVSKAAASDRLEDTLNYGEVYDVIAAQMAVHSDLLEHVCGRIVDAIEAQWPELENITVRVSKRNPPVNGPAKWSRVTISSRTK